MKREVRAGCGRMLIGVALDVLPLVEKIISLRSPRGHSLVSLRIPRDFDLYVLSESQWVKSRDYDRGCINPCIVASLF